MSLLCCVVLWGHREVLSALVRSIELRKATGVRAGGTSGPKRAGHQARYTRAVELKSAFMQRCHARYHARCHTRHNATPRGLGLRVLAADAPSAPRCGQSGSRVGSPFESQSSRKSSALPCIANSTRSDSALADAADRVKQPARRSSQTKQRAE